MLRVLAVVSMLLLVAAPEVRGGPATPFTSPIYLSVVMERAKGGPELLAVFLDRRTGARLGEALWGFPRVIPGSSAFVQWADDIGIDVATGPWTERERPEGRWKRVFGTAAKPGIPPTGRSPSLAWAPDGKKLYYFSSSRGLVVWDRKSGKVSPATGPRLHQRDLYSMFGIDCDPSGQRLTYSTEGNELAPFDRKVPRPGSTTDDDGRCNEVYVAAIGSRNAKPVGTGFTPRFMSRDRLLVVDRLRDTAGLGLKTYELPTGETAWLRRDCLAACPIDSGKRILAVLTSGTIAVLRADGAPERALSSVKGVLTKRDLEYVSPVEGPVTGRVLGAYIESRN